MSKDKIKIWRTDGNVTLTCCSEAGGRRPAVIILPGGGYIAAAPSEGEPVGERFAQMGYAAFVLKYSTMYSDFEHTSGEPNRRTMFPGPIVQVGSAIKYLRANAESLGVDENKIAVMGFSAGGHLAATFGNYWNSPHVYSGIVSDPGIIRPNATVLCYAVTRLRKVRGSSMNKAIFLCGDEKPSDEQLRMYSPVNNVGEQTPPTFLWHSAADTDVPVQQSYAMSSALMAAKRPYELHVYSSGPHATGLSVGYPAETWPQLADSFLKRYM